MSYRNMRFAYQTPIRRYERDALSKAAALAVERSTRYMSDCALGHAYRVIDTTYSVTVDADRDEYASDTRLEIVAFPITKRTENGFRIRLGGWDHAPETTWIAFRHTKQFASLTPEGALASYAARRRRQASIYQSRAHTAQVMAEQAEYLLTKKDDLP